LFDPENRYSNHESHEAHEEVEESQAFPFHLAGEHGNDRLALPS